MTGESIISYETHNAAQAGYDRLAALRISAGPRLCLH